MRSWSVVEVIVAVDPDFTCDDFVFLAGGRESPFS
jgi:hypothetical protein